MHHFFILRTSEIMAPRRAAPSQLECHDGRC
jgi:hypothetical protein